MNRFQHLKANFGYKAYLLIGIFIFFFIICIGAFSGRRAFPPSSVPIRPIGFLFSKRNFYPVL